MNIDQIAIVIILMITFGLFIYGRWRYDIVSVTALFILIIADKCLGDESSTLINNYNQIFLGFGHPAVITVAAVLIISRSLRNSGVVDFITRRIKPFTKIQTMHISSLSGVIALLSGFMNNVGALALMLPVTIKTAWENERSPRILLMPIAFASILGGMITMIGTPPNIIIANVRKEQLELIVSQAIADSTSLSANYLKLQNIGLVDFEPTAFGLFDFTPVGSVIAILGVLFIALIGWKLIPNDKDNKSNSRSIFSIDKYVTEIRIPENCSLIGENAGEVNNLTGDKITLIRKINKNEEIEYLDPNYILSEGDQFLIMADPTELKIAMDEYNFKLTKEMRFRIDSLKEDDTTFMEVVVTPESSLLGRTRNYFRNKTSNCLTLISVARNDNPITKRLGRVKFSIGDVLLIQGREEELKNNTKSLNLLPLENRDIDIGIFSKIGFSVLVFIGAILLSMFGVFPATISFIGAILIYIFSGILPVRDLYKSIDWPIIVLLGSMIPISDALQSTGTTAIVANLMVGLTSGLPTWLVLAIIMIITMSLSDIINNAATALIMAPISVGIAMSMGVSIDPFLMSVAVGASCAFLTPIGHQCNALILGPGGYKFGDYWRMGLPLEILIVIIGTPAIIYFWPL
ncbi:MAG: SLC13 family permease [Candidatus Marinimicrobia bacterium]|jgi:di/tricarboxylate transporter|nr:SLC13 family permease [Candidatus Neomarinimicrobiota bacterium]MBT3676123.1 SLC13 family permease [Candidatus Neomarinimicrobiota bacterium]MBT3763028.1 SLC13 family permease [Candidatus Neomarinimicrobiota bacterium]MBT4068669.1 SLC13 family permease [Candidatus Neomarinimicrobiota bacterium]MBT4270742.1 SLC13 family permease [Candidatus Neomarinimicrobiota bacterium]